MIFSTLPVAVQWVIQNGYLLMFVVMLVEGPVITAAGAFVAALGFFNIWVVLVLSILGNFIPDLLYYALGRWGRETFMDKYGHYFGLNKDKIKRIEGMIDKHSLRSLVIIKLIPLLATPGLIVAGLTKMNFRKYVRWSLIITVPTSLFYLIIGYYFGAAYDTIARYLRIGGFLILIFVAVFALIVYLENKFSDRIVEKMEE
jgi:membrane protein DedA with SNARE-associated domain